MEYLNVQTFSKVYTSSSVHRNSRLKKSDKMQMYMDIYLLLNYSTCFGHPSRSPYLVTFEEACFPDSMISTRGCNYSTPDDGCDGRPKHVE